LTVSDAIYLHKVQRITFDTYVPLDK